jgi:hypothetical protein
MAGGRHAKPLLSNRIAIARVRQRLPVIVCVLFEMAFDLSFRTVFGGFYFVIANASNAFS